LLETLSAAVQADAAKNSAKAKRLQRLQAAIASQTQDPAIDARVNAVRGELKRLGLDIISVKGRPRRPRIAQENEGREMAAVAHDSVEDSLRGNRAY
jgi:hypothetical protein